MWRVSVWVHCNGQESHPLQITTTLTGKVAIKDRWMKQRRKPTMGVESECLSNKSSCLHYPVPTMLISHSQSIPCRCMHHDNSRDWVFTWCSHDSPTLIHKHVAKDNYHILCGAVILCNSPRWPQEHGKQSWCHHSRHHSGSKPAERESEKQAVKH